MAIKWKNSLALLAFTLLLTFGLRGLFFSLGDGTEYLKKDYFRTQQFENQLDEFIDYLSTYELNYISSEELKKKITVTADEINEHRYRYGDLVQQVADIQNQYDQKLREADAIRNKEVGAAYIEERDRKIEDIKNNFLSDEHVRKKIVAEKEQKIDEYFLELEKSRSKYENLKTEFKYFLRDTTTGEVYSNLSMMDQGESGGDINKQTMLTFRSYPTINGGNVFNNRGNYGIANTTFSYDVNRLKLLSAKERRFEGKIGVPIDSPSTSTVMANYLDFRQKKNLYIIYIVCSLIALLASWYLNKKTLITQGIPWDKVRSAFNRIPLDVRTIGFGLTLIIMLVMLTNTPALYLYENPYSFIKTTLTDLFFTAIMVSLVVIQGKLWFEKRKDLPGLKKEWCQSFVYKAYQSAKEVFLNRSMGTQVLLLLGVCFAFGAGTVAVFIEPEILVIYIPLFLVLGIPALSVILKRTGYFNRIVANTNEIVQGNLGADLPVKGKSGLAILASNVNKLKNGVKVSQKEQAKSERLKTELITNVSHDLRTPLTSIITYTELLKTPELTNEDREAYVQIIDRKAKRLKVLIDDLFEASKMASGNIELVKEKVDLVQLLQQALAEYNEAMSDSTLTFRVSSPEEPIYALVDGQKLWRVFENLIGNILKYSMENTRVFITVKSLNGKAQIGFKNITKYELGENSDELFERFKRGDTSRHTEGSGLGLAIAKSIVDLHGGDLDIEVDGDLFKVTVNLDCLEK